MTTVHQIRNEMYTSIRGYNRHLSTDLLQNMGLMPLLRNCHPAERQEFAMRLERGGHLKLTRDDKDSLFGHTNPFKKKAD